MTRILCFLANDRILSNTDLPGRGQKRHILKLLIYIEPRMRVLKRIDGEQDDSPTVIPASHEPRAESCGEPLCVLFYKVS